MIVLLLAVLAHAADPWTDVASAAGMDVAQVKELAGVAEKRDSVLERMATPWEAKPWHQYHPIFLTEERLRKGLAFWDAHADSLAAAEARYGVPAHVIVAILGVETRYGEVMGDDPVVDALFTLGFHHPRRGAFFRAELGHYLRLAKDEGWGLRDPRGSYAGAMGMGQFIPSSYRAYAVDGDGDGDRDLFASPDDAIASIANYLHRHGWRAGEPVLLEATATDAAAAPFVGKELKPTHRLSDLAAAKVAVKEALAPETPARLYAFELPTGREYRVGLQNFYAITRYNHSALYARVVHDLSEQLRRGRR